MIGPRLGAFLAVVFWGISFVATKAVLGEISPMTLIFLRLVIGVALLFALVRSFPPRELWPSLALMGFVGVAFHQLLQAYALTLTSATHTGWLIGLTPIWSAILAAILGRERFDRWKVLGLIGGFGGALLVMTKGRFDPAVFSLPSTKGDLMILISTFNWAAYSVIGHDTIRRLGPRRATTGAMFCGLVMLTPFFVARQGWRELPSLTPMGWGAVLFLGVFCSALGYLFWYGALERIEVSRVSAFLYIEPLVTFVTAVLVLQETVSAVAVIGGLVVLGSVVLMQRGSSS